MVEGRGKRGEGEAGGQTHTSDVPITSCRCAYGQATPYHHAGILISDSVTPDHCVDIGMCVVYTHTVYMLPQIHEFENQVGR